MESNEQSSMSDRHGAVQPVLIEEELKTSFLDYAMSVVISRAIPDIRDGLKPVHRRVLYTMYELGFFYNKPYHKSARVVGDVLGKYHPHGNEAIYNTMVGMVQDFSKRYPLLDGQGNWGSVDGDNAAAMRYTEVRMTKIAQELLADIDKETVPFVPNFDDSTVEPALFPSRLPHLLINGTAGIAVGMATSIPPHNLGEVIDACIALLERPDLPDEELFTMVPAPDFPTGGIICGRAGIVQAYKTGRGNLIVRSVVDIEETKKGSQIVVTQLPYQVNKAELIIKIAELVRDKVVDGITNIRDESNRKGMRLVIEVRRGEVPQVILNQLYKHTAMQTSISILMLGLLHTRPMVFSLRQLLEQFLIHRKEIIYKRTLYDIGKARAREHILAGFIIALEHIDGVIAIIKNSRIAEEAIAVLQERFFLSGEQSKAILDMRLQRLTGMEQEKIHIDIAAIRNEIARLQSILDHTHILQQAILTELVAIKEQYSDARKTRIEGHIDALTQVDLIPDEDVVVTLTMRGYVKRVVLETYGVQHRGGKGKMGMVALDSSEDVVQDIFVAKNHDVLLFFTNLGRIYSMPVFEVPEASRTAKGRAVINLLPLAADERVVKLLCARDMENKFLIMLTRKGVIKRTDAMEFIKIRSTGIRAITLNDGDELVWCAMSSGKDEIIIATAMGQGIHFPEGEVRAMGRQAAGVIGIRLRQGDQVVGMDIVSSGDEQLIFVTENGYGKQVVVSDFRLAHRGGVGVRTIPTDNRNGLVVGIARIQEQSHILLIDRAGKIIRLSPKEIRTMGRQARGVRLVRLDAGQIVTAVVSFEGADDEQ